VIALLLLLLLLLAIVPQNERRLFVFAGPALTGGTIELPEPTSFREAIFQRVLDQVRPPREREPEFIPARPDDWSDGLFDPNALMPEVDEAFLMSDLPQLPRPNVSRSRRIFERGAPLLPELYGSPASAIAPIPEPAPWLLMIVGFAVVGRQYRLGRRMRPVPA